MSPQTATPLVSMESELIDAIGTRHDRAGAEARIVSLVPSITELLFDLGLGSQIVGRTGFCIHPRERIRNVPKVGGTKTFDLERIRELAPSHVVVNIDENPRAAVEALAPHVPHIIVTHPLGPLDNPPLYRLLGGIFARDAELDQLCIRFDATLHETKQRCARLPTQNVLYLIWKSPWMTVSRDTYISRMLAVAGWGTMEIAGGSRYPKFDLHPALLDRVDLVLLSSEPYRFRAQHCAEIESLLPSGSRTKVMLIDGAMTSWYGSRAIRGLEYLARLRTQG